MTARHRPTWWAAAVLLLLSLLVVLLPYYAYAHWRARRDRANG